MNQKVLSMLESLEIDYLGVSLDALLLIAPPDAANEIMDAIRGAEVRIGVVGEAVPEEYERMCAAVGHAAAEEAEKRDRVVARVRGA